MVTAHQKARSYANVETCSNNENGVSKAIQCYVFNAENN